MYTDFQRLAALPSNDTNAVGRAALHVLFAHAASFGTTCSRPEDMRQLIQRAVDGGSQIALAMKNVLEYALCEDTFGLSTSKRYNKALRLAIRMHARSEFSKLDHLSPISTFDSLLAACQRFSHGNLTAHYAVIHQLTSLIPRDYINLRSPLTGETALSLACRLGDYESASMLLKLGADSSICSDDNCTPLHWMFMFDDNQMDCINLNHSNVMNAMGSRPQVLDAQLPADFEGTPLSFAVAAASSNAVSVLLRNNLYKEKHLKHSTIHKAWSQASSLHLYEILEQLYLFAPWDALYGVELRDITKSSSVIRKLIHGRNEPNARKSTLKVMLEHDHHLKICRVVESKMILRKALGRRSVYLDTALYDG